MAPLGFASLRGALAPLAIALALLLADGARGNDPNEAMDDLQKVEVLHLDDVAPGPGGERVVDLYLRATTRFGVPVRGIRAADLEIREDDEIVDPSDVRVETLESAGRGAAVVVAIDASGTMKGEPFEHAKEAALALLERLRPEDRLAIVSFAEEVRVAADFNLTRAEARAALRALEIDPQRSQHTLFFDGVHRALRLVRERRDLPRRVFAVLFSDGKDGGSDRSLEHVVQLAKGGEGEPQILVFSVGYPRFGGEGLEGMRRLAEGTGGDFMEAASSAHVRDFFDAVATQILRSYVVRFPSSMDGERHALRVGVEGHSAERQALYPRIAGPLWPYLAFPAAAAFVALLLYGFQRGGRPGRIAIVSGPKAGTVISLNRGKNVIGALEGSDIVLSLATVSRQHAEVNVRGSRAEIVDLHSTNGTRVNGQIVQRAPLRPGDRIRIADVELVYER